jgi:hypothetical protein
MNRARRMMAMGMFDSGDPFAGYSYYVNSVTGSDDNAGTSSLAPFATLTKLLTVWQAGQSVGLAKGSTWREELLFPGNSSAAYAYGASGNKPVLDASDIAAKASISKTGGQTNVYQIAVSLPTRVGEDNWVNVWEDDVFLTKTASIAACDAAAGSYYIAAHTGDQTLYIHATDSSDVSANAKVYTYAKRLTGVSTINATNYYTGCTISGIRTQKQLSQSGSLKVGKSTTVTNCDAYYGNKHNVYYQTGCNLTNVTGSEAYFAGAGSIIFILNLDVGDAAGATLTNCTASLTTYDASNQGFGGHINTSGTLGTINYINCTVTNCGQGFSSQAGTVTNNYTNCTITGCGRGFTFTHGTTHNISGGSYTYGTGGKVFLNSTTALTINFTNGFTSTYDSSHATGGMELSVNSTLNISDCVFIDNNAAAAGYFLLSTNNIVFTGLRNNFRSPNLATAGIYVYRLVGAGGTYASDYNTYSKNSFYYSLGSSDTYTTLAAYQAAKNQDLNSTVG